MGIILGTDFARGEYRYASKTITFTGAAGAGAVGTVLVFTVTGAVYLDWIFAYCTTDLTEAAPTSTVALGVPASTAGMVAATNSTTIDTGEFWINATPATAVDIAATALTAAWYLYETTINITVATQNTDGGVIDFHAWYLPCSTGAVLT